MNQNGTSITKFHSLDRQSLEKFVEATGINIAGLELVHGEFPFLNNTNRKRIEVALRSLACDLKSKRPEVLGPHTLALLVEVQTWELRGQQPEGLKPETQPEGVVVPSGQETVMFPVSELVVDPSLKGLVDRPSKEEFEAMMALTERIGKIRNALRVDRASKRVVDGYTRLDLCALFGIEIVPVVFEDLPAEEEKIAYVGDSALAQRQLSEWQKCKLGYNIYQEIEEKAAKARQSTRAKGMVERPDPEEAGAAVEKVAKRVGVSVTTYQRAKRILDAAKEAPEKYGYLAEEIGKGTMKITPADEILKTERAKASEQSSSLVKTEESSSPEDDSAPDRSSSEELEADLQLLDDIDPGDPNLDHPDPKSSDEKESPDDNCSETTKPKSSRSNLAVTKIFLKRLKALDQELEAILQEDTQGINAFLGEALGLTESMRAKLHGHLRKVKEELADLPKAA